MTGTAHKQEHEEGADDSVDEPAAKRHKMSNPTDVSTTDGMAILLVVDHADEIIYEPEPKRRKISQGTKVDIRNIFESADESPTGEGSAGECSDDEGFADDEADIAGFEDDPNESLAGDEADNTGPKHGTDESIADDKTDATLSSEDSDGSFVHNEADMTDSNDDSLTIASETESTLSFASSSTAVQSMTPISGGTPSSSSSNASPSAHTTTYQSTIHAATSMNVPQSVDDLQYGEPLRPRGRNSQASGCRQVENFTIYEDETATLPGQLEAEFTNNGWMPRVNHRALARALRGQENRRPVRRALVRRFDMAQFLDEDDGVPEEVGGMAGLRLADIWPIRDAFGVTYRLGGH